MEPHSSEGCAQRPETVPPSPQPGGKLQCWGLLASQCDTDHPPFLLWEMVQINFLINYVHHPKGLQNSQLHLFKYILIVYCTLVFHLHIKDIFFPHVLIAHFGRAAYQLLQSLETIKFYLHLLLSSIVMVPAKCTCVCVHACVCLNSVTSTQRLRETQQCLGEFPEMILRY